MTQPTLTNSNAFTDTFGSSLTFTFSTTGTDKLVFLHVGAFFGSSTLPTITSSASRTWTLLADAADPSSGYSGVFWAVVPTAVTDETVTATFGADAAIVMNVDEWSGATSYSGLTENTDYGTATLDTDASVTTTPNVDVTTYAADSHVRGFITGFLGEAWGGGTNTTAVTTSTDTATLARSDNPQTSTGTYNIQAVNGSGNSDDWRGVGLVGYEVLGVSGGGATQTLTPSLLTNSQTFYSAAITQAGEAQTLTPSLFTNTQTFYSPTVSLGGVTLQPALFTNSQTFYSPTVSVGAVTLTPDLFTNTNTFYSPVVTQAGGAQVLAPDLFTNTNAFYTPTITTSYTLEPSLFTNTQTFFSPTVTQDSTQTIEPTLFVNENVFYSPVVTGGDQALGRGASSAGYWREWWNKPDYKDAVKRKKLSTKAKRIIKEVAKALPDATDEELTQDQELALRLKLVAEKVGYNPLYLNALQEEIQTQAEDATKEEEEAVTMLMMMLV